MLYRLEFDYGTACMSMFVETPQQVVAAIMRWGAKELSKLEEVNEHEG